MISDALLLFSNAQAVTASAASESVVDVAAARNIGVGTDLYVNVNVDVAMTDGGGNTYPLVVWLYADSTDTFTPDASVTLFTIPAASAIGVKRSARIPFDTANYRYLSLRYIPTGGNLTAGSFTATVSLNADAYTSYANGSDIF